MSQLPITLACGPYDRTRALADGRVTVGGADLRYVPLDPEEYEHVVAAMGADYWSYGLEPNRHVLSAFARYAAAQHLVSREFAPEQLFAPETGEEFVI